MPQSRGSSVCFRLAEEFGGIVAPGLERGREALELQLDFAKARGEPVALVPERSRQRDHGLDETTLALLDAADGGRKDLDRRMRGHRQT